MDLNRVNSKQYIDWQRLASRTSTQLRDLARRGLRLPEFGGLSCEASYRNRVDSHVPIEDASEPTKDLM
jgi:hypothetical protein